MDDPDGHFGERVARTYDDSTGAEFQPEVVARTAELLAELAGGRGARALEFAIGTGRIAVPLAERGVAVHGIDMSRAMVDRLRAKNAEIGVTIGDFSTVRAGSEFDLVYLVFNTVMNLTTQDAQVECFRNAAAHLRAGGRFLIEVMLPELRKLPAGQTLVPFTATPTSWGFDRYDVATQEMSSNYVTLLEDGRGEFWSVPFRYAWPAEMDLMARIAGLRPEHRWDSWARTPFTGESSKVIATWVKP